MITLKLKDAVKVDNLPDRVLARANRSQVSLTVGKYTVVGFVKVQKYNSEETQLKDFPTFK